jgi:hypothetical protein
MLESRNQWKQQAAEKGRPGGASEVAPPGFGERTGLLLAENGTICVKYSNRTSRVLYVECLRETRSILEDFARVRDRGNFAYAQE